MFKLAITNNLHFTILIELTIITFLLVLLVQWTGISHLLSWLGRVLILPVTSCFMNHFTPKISLVILLTVCHIVFFFFWNVSLENLLLDQLIIP